MIRCAELGGGSQARAMLEHDTDLSADELDRLFETGKSTDDGGFWIVVE